MAKKKQSKKQAKENHRRAMEAKRQQTGWQAPQPELETPTVLDDMATLIPDLRQREPSAQDMTAYLEVLAYSDWMVQEPEFDGVYFMPSHLLIRYLEAAQDTGIDEDVFITLSEEEKSDRHADWLSAALDSMLTEEFIEGLTDRARRLRERLLGEGKKEEAARAGLVQNYLEQEEKAVTWPGVGLVLGLGQRSLEAAWDLQEAFETLHEAPAKDWEEQGPAIEAMTRYPGLMEMMVAYHDRLWFQVLDDLFDGTLWLDLYRDEELESQLNTWERALAHDQRGEQKEVDALSEEISQYAAGLLTPERIGQMMAHLTSLEEKDALEPEEIELVDILEAKLIDPTTASQGIFALTNAFFGELGLLFEEMQLEAEWEEDK